MQLKEVPEPLSGGKRTSCNPFFSVDVAYHSWGYKKVTREDKGRIKGG
jgi:hypothetical protein